MSPPARSFSLFARVLRRARHTLYGRRAGLGLVVPVAALDHEYASGAWDHFFSADELPRYQTIIELVAKAHPRPRVLDLGCGSGRLASLLDPARVAGYLGVDVSEAGLERARALGLPPSLSHFQRADIETWSPETGAHDLVVCNESLDYTSDPLRTALRFAATLPPGGALLVSRHRSGNHAAFWRRLARAFAFSEARVAANPAGQRWDVRILRPLSASRPDAVSAS